ncbi:MAG: RNA-binding domain-containing protein [Chloroflexota bacterium]
MAERILPAQVALGLTAFRRALDDLKRAVDRRAPLDAVSAAIDRVRAESEELDRLAPEASVLTGSDGVARHLRRASFSASERGEYPDQDVTHLVGLGLAAVVNRIHAETAVPDRATILRAALASLEGPSIEFKETFPAQTHTLAKEFAALAPGGGSVFLGVADNGSVVGLDVVTTPELDEVDRRLRSIAASVDPPVAIATAWLAFNEMVVVEARVNPSGEPIHFVEGRAYLSDGSASRPARQAEVKRAIREHETRRPLFRLEPERASLLRDADGQPVGAFARVRVTNLSGFTCARVTASARFLTIDGVQAFNRSMPLRWSSAPEPVSPIWTPAGLRMRPDPSKVSRGLAVDMDPGDTEDTALAVKFVESTRAWGWTSESYLNNGRHPSWKLPEGRQVVEVTVSAEGRDVTERFVLDSGAPIDSFAVTPMGHGASDPLRVV